MSDKVITITEEELNDLCNKAINYCDDTSCYDCHLINKEGCSRKILIHKILAFQSQKPKSWKFAMPSGEIAKVKCRDKLFHLRLYNPVYSFYYNDGKGIRGFDNFDHYSGYLKEYEELTLSEFLALPEPQPKKKLLPEWVRKGKFMLFRDCSDSLWIVNSLKDITADAYYPFEHKAKINYRMIAPLDESFHLKKDNHPQQITFDDLSSYDVEAWREENK